MNNPTINVPEVVETHRVGRGQIMVIVLCGLLMLLDGFDTQAISYIVPVLAKQWHMPREMLGVIFSSALVGLMVGYLVIAPLSNRFGHKRMMVASTVVFSIFTLATVYATALPQLIALRFLTGLGLGAAAPSAIALSCEYSPKRLRATFVLLIYCGFSLGFVLAGFAAGMLIPRFGWTSLLWVGAIAPLFLSVALALWLPESMAFVVAHRHDDGQMRRIMKKLFPGLAMPAGCHFIADLQASERSSVGALFGRRNRLGTVLLWGIFFINLAEFYFLQSWLPTLLNGLHYPPAQIVWITALPTIGGVLSVLALGPSMDRIGPYVTLTVVYLLGAAFMTWLAASLSASPSSTPWMLMAAAFCAGFCISGGQKGVIALAAIYYPLNLRSTGVGWALGIGRLGGIAGPFVVGLLYTAKWQSDRIFYVAAIPVLFAALAVFVMGRLYDAGQADRARGSARAGTHSG